MNKKEMIFKIEKALEKGESKSGIFSRLKTETKDTNFLARLVAMFPDKHLREKHRNLNGFLVGALIFTAVLKVLTGLSLLQGTGLLGIPLLLFMPLLNLVLAWEALRMRGYVYGVILLLSAAAIANTAQGFADPNIDPILSVGQILILTFIALLSRAVGKRLFPNYGLLGPKKGKDGEVLF